MNIGVREYQSLIILKLVIGCNVLVLINSNLSKRTNKIIYSCHLVLKLQGTMKHW